VVEEIHSFHQRMLIISQQSKRVVLLIFVKRLLWLNDDCCLVSHRETLRLVLRRSRRGQLRQVVLVGSHLLFTLDALLIRLLIGSIRRDLLAIKVIFK
jgi:hypothetical protein